MGSNPVGVTTWAISSAGRAPALQAGCQQFDPVIAHHEKSCTTLVVQLFFVLGNRWKMPSVYEKITIVAELV